MSVAFSLGLYERMRGTYLDVSRCVVEWNHENETQVGSPTVLTVKVHYYYKHHVCVLLEIGIVSIPPLSLPPSHPSLPPLPPSLPHPLPPSLPPPTLPPSLRSIIVARRPIGTLRMYKQLMCGCHMHQMCI